MIGRISSSVFVGREQELARLADLAAADADAPRLALIGGDAGIGKTRLVIEFAAGLGDSQVLMGGCLQLGAGASPLAPITEILRRLTRERGEDAVRRLLAGPRAALAGVLGESTSARERGPLGGPDASQLHEAVLSLLETLAEDTLLVVVLEDLHWAAPTMLDLVTFLARNPPHGPVLLLGTFRADELHRRHPLRPVLADLSRLGTVERIDLEPLTASQQRQQAENILGRPLTESEATNLARSEGNAFFVEELVSSPAAGDLPGTLRDVLSDRLAALPEDADEVARVAAAAGRTVDHRLLEKVADLDTSALRSGLRAAVEHGVLVPEDHRYRFRHALLQEAAYDELLPGERLRIHRALADALTVDRDLAADGSAGADAEIAHHADPAMLPDLGYTASLAAAERAEGVFAFDEALAHLERALTLRDSCTADTLADGQTRLDLLQRAGDIAVSAGEEQRALGHYDTALKTEAADATAEQTADLYNAVALTHKGTADIEAGMTASDQALAVAPAGTSQRARALSYKALYLAIRHGQPEDALGLAQEALDLARSKGDPKEETSGRLTLATVLGVLGRLDDAIPLFRSAIDMAVAQGRMLEATIGHINLGSSLAGAGRLTESQSLEASWLRHCEARGYATAEVDFLRCNHVSGLVLSGHPGAAEKELAKVRRRREAYLSAAIELFVALARFDEVSRLLNEHRDLIARLAEPQFLLIVAEAEAILALVDAHYEDAWQVLARARDLPSHRETYESIRPRAARVEADRLTRSPVDDATRERSLERFDLLRADLERLLADAEGPVWAAHLRTALAQVAAERTRAEGKPDPDAWLAAEEGVAKQGRLPEVAYLKIRRAEAFAGLDYREEAAALLREVHADCVARGMVWCVQQAEAVAKRARIKLPGVGGPSADPFGLTDRERDVLALLTQGLTNPQIGERLFISDKTASVHVSHILTKLNAGNRNQAAAIARDHGLDTG